ncbi:MAG: hypothetical protein JWM02_1890, partial [Frankiales bacterium]|nr:hypothetical protein [Frankiales bacterium]
MLDNEPNDTTATPVADSTTD